MNEVLELEKDPQVRMTLETITPIIADAWLLKNKNNRRIISSIVERYAQEIINNRWSVNGETIKFDVNGNLIDGQHRLLAVVKSKKIIKSFVVYYLPVTTFSTIDIGRKRTSSESLQIIGAKYSSTISASLRLFYQYQCIEKGESLPFQTPNPNRNPSNNDIINLYTQYKHKIEESAKLGQNFRNIVKTSIATFCYFVCGQINQTDADYFFDNLLNGTALPKSSPILVLRERLIRDKMSQLKISNDIKIVFIFKAWNAYREHRNISILRWTDGESFPFPK